MFIDDAAEGLRLSPTIPNALMVQVYAYWLSEVAEAACNGPQDPAPERFVWWAQDDVEILVSCEVGQAVRRQCLSDESCIGGEHYACAGETWWRVTRLHFSCDRMELLQRSKDAAPGFDFGCIIARWMTRTCPFSRGKADTV